jgi:hypothetical protein
MTEQINTTEIDQATAVVIGSKPGIAKIETAAQANEVAAYKGEVARLRKRISDFFRPNIDSAHALHKSLLAQLKQADEGPAAAESYAIGLLNDYAREQARKQREEQDRLDREAREQAAAAARAAAAAARAEGDRQAALNAQREAARIESGKQVVASTVVAVAPKIAGIASVETYSAQCVDMVALMKAIISGKAAAGFVQFDQAFANKLARSLKMEMRVPGIQVNKETSVRGTR